MTLLEIIIDHNLIHDHDSFACREIINSGILMIILTVLKLFIDDRNSFSVEKWNKLHQTKSQPIPMEESVLSQTNEEVKTDSLHMTSITTPIENVLKTLERTYLKPWRLQTPEQELK